MIYDIIHRSTNRHIDLRTDIDENFSQTSFLYESVIVAQQIHTLLSSLPGLGCDAVLYHVLPKLLCVS